MWIKLYIMKILEILLKKTAIFIIIYKWNTIQEIIIIYGFESMKKNYYIYKTYTTPLL